MPLIDDPLEQQSILTPRGFNPFPGATSETAPPVLEAKPEENIVPPWMPSPLEKLLVGVQATFNPLGAIIAGVMNSPAGLAAGRTENTIGSALSRAYDTWGVSNDIVDPTYNPWADIVGTKYEPYWKNTFMGSNNKAYTEVLKKTIDRQEEDRKIVANSGATGIIAGMIAGTLDPTILIPGAGEVSYAGKGVWRVGKMIGVGARAGGEGMLAQELGLQATQDVRPLSESAMNVGTGIILGAVLGGGAAAVLSRAQAGISEKGLETIQRVMAPEGLGDAGAAAARQATIQQMTIDGATTEAIAAATAISPNMRAHFYLSPLARQSALELGASPLYLKGHAEGIAFDSIKDRIGVSIGETFDQAMPAHMSIFEEGKKAGFGMSKDEFENAVGRAMRNADVGENDYVTRAAKVWRDKVIEPLKDRVIEQGLLKEGVTVDEAASYFMRMYNREAIIARSGVFMDKAVNYINGIMKAGYAKDAEKIQGRIGKFDEQLADMKLSPEERVKALADLEAQRSMLDEQYPSEMQLKTRIDAARGEVRKAKTAEEKAAAEVKVQALKDSGGAKYEEYNKALREVTTRRKALNFNEAGLLEKQADIQNSIDNMVEANDRHLNKLVERGKKLARELQKFDEAKRQKLLSDLRTQFHQLIEQSNAAQDKLAARLEKLVDVPEAAKKKLREAAKKEASRFEWLNKLDDRLQAAEALDYKASVDEIKATVEELVKEVSAKTFTRAEKVARWKEKMAKLDPKKVEERVKAVEEAKAKMEREFFNRWEVKRLGEGVNAIDPKAEVDFINHARDLADNLYNKITGNDWGSNVVDPEFRLPVKTGPLKDRTFHIADKELEGFLEDNVVKVMNKYSRTMSAQIELANKYEGDINLRNVIGEIEKQYDAMRQALEQNTEMPAKEVERNLRKLDKDRKGAIRDIEALRDIHMGRYEAEANASTFGRIVRALMNFNYVRMMGGAAIPSLSDIYAPAMTHGLMPYMEGLSTVFKSAAREKLFQEAKYSGVVEKWLHHRMMTISEVGDPYGKGTAIERLLDNATRPASTLNGLNILTDFEKQFTGIILQDRLMDAVTKQTDRRWLAWSGINDDMRDKIAKQVLEHGETIDGVRVPNTEKWTDDAARRAYRVAIRRGVNADIVTREAGDIPLAFYKPLGRLLTQFKTFNIAAHQKLMLRGLQGNQLRLMSTLIGMTTVGAIAAWLKSWFGGVEAHKRFMDAASNPGFVVGEALDNTGLFTLPIEIGNMFEASTRAAGSAALKGTSMEGVGLNPVKSPLLVLGHLVNPEASMQGSSARFAQTGILDALAGPTGRLAGDIGNAAAGGVNVTRGQDATMGQKRSAARLVPFNSYIGFRQLFQYMMGDSPVQQH